MKQNPDNDKCPKNFKLYAALVIGLGCMVVTLGILDSLQKGRLGYDEGQPKYSIQKVTAVLESGESNAVEQPWLGIEIQDIDETIVRQLDLRNENGVLVSKVVQGSPAQKSGIIRGDVIVRFDRRSIKDASFLQNLVAKLSIGQRVQVVLARNGDYKSLYIMVGVAPISNLYTASFGSELSQWGIDVSPITEPLAQSFGIPESKEGVLVVQVQPAAMAALAGLQTGDLIMSVNSTPTPDMLTFISAISSTQEAVFDIFRDDENLYFVADENDKP